MLIGLFTLKHFFPEIASDGFVLPGGKLAAWMLGAAPATWDGASVSFYVQGLLVQVTSACSGYGFFCILSAWVGYQLGSKGLRFVLLLLPACWPLAVCINALRVTASVHTRQLAAEFLPDTYFNVVHQATGMLVFLTFLILVSIIIQIVARHVSASAPAKTLPTA
ncbi:archaeosortase/exosortase family protein [Ruficoccus sp. ZRK36]|uniref:archaeosortase/exosortase family protein n=1 Tax=Ruficoccus sp. ZRK36 TaxID=2866311 RepID=UPI001C72FFC1|nr:archaeosortase/exosortase family protein [Ruficoccus sp. ZRK36]QYY35383.1 archaeosortase/exosortase family protein [Ruficoccus sp. ZRK36]